MTAPPSSIASVTTPATKSSSPPEAVGYNDRDNAIRHMGLRAEDEDALLRVVSVQAKSITAKTRETA